jgi:NAD(P)-dependent dehydrogenase (short-subunit alcohol dehydrogenase family)
MGIIEKMRLDGKKGFVTGGARGIGKSVALALCEAGADIAIVDMDLEEAEKTAKWLSEETGRNCFATKTDVTDQGDVNRMIDQVLAAYGRIDIAF